MSLEARPEVIIADPGVDDAVGILVASAMKRDNELCFVSTFGNATASITSANFRGLEDFIHTNLKEPVIQREVYLGAEKEDAPLMDFIHGPNALEGQFGEFSPALTPSHVLYDRLSKEHTGGIDVISLGALREVSSLLNRSDSGNVKSLTVMGGAIFVQGNIAPRVEANIGGDPVALQDVLRSVTKKKIPTTIVPLDVTQLPELEFTPERVANLAQTLRNNGSNNVADLIEKIVGPDATYTRFYQGKRGVFSNRYPFGEQRYKGAAMHDLTAILVRYHPELFTLVEMRIVSQDDGEISLPTEWMDEYKNAASYQVVMDIKDADEYWRLTAEYLSRYS